METTIIELREEKSTNDPNNQINGKFSITTKNVTLNDGDELNVRNIFIDSKKESNTIVVETDTTLTMTFLAGVNLNTDIQVVNGYTGGDPKTVNGGNVMFLNKTATSGDPQAKDSFGGVIFAENSNTGIIRSFLSDGNIGRGSVNDDPVNRGDTFTYFPCRRNPPTDGSVGFLQSFNVDINNFQTRAEGGNFFQQFRYTDIEGQSRIFKVFIPEVNMPLNGGQTTVSTEFNGVLFNIADGLTPISPSENQLKTAQFNVRYSDFQHNDSETHNILHPIERTASVLIPAGEYQPDILAQRINIGLNSYNKFLKTEFTAGVNALISNDSRGREIFSKGGVSNLYAPTNQNYGGSGTTNFIFDDNVQNAYQFTHSGSDYFHMVSEDDSNIILKVLNNLGDNQGGLAHVSSTLYGGSTSFQLVFDQNTSTFKMVNLHTPYYVSVGNPAISQIGVKLNKTGIFGNGDCMSLDTIRSEIRITSLTSSGDGDDKNFWFDKLGFDPSVITQIGSAIKNYLDFQPDGGNANLYVPTFSNKGAVDFGISKTAPFVSGELIVQNNKFTVDYMANITYPVLIPNTDTIDIFSLKTLNDLIVDDGYYKVVIRGTQATSNRLHDDDGIRLISAIVGKYYSGESYTNGFSTDGIQYIHRGEPIVTLSNFEIEITK